jgi:ADP-ribose pyrophosphatase YjhB (NUDIX family)
VTPRPTLAASIAVFRGGRVLIAKRVANPGEGLWSLPGGRVEPGETLEAAALRELFEEVGVAASILAFNRHVEVIRRDRAGALASHFVVATFVGTWVSGEARTGPEAADIAWIDPHRLAGRRTTDGLAEILAGAAAIHARLAAKAAV